MTDEARKRTPLRDMIDIAEAEARRIAIVQQALVEVGELKAPDPGQVRRQHAFEDIGRLLRLMEPHAKRIAAIILPPQRNPAPGPRRPAEEPNDD